MFRISHEGVLWKLKNAKGPKIVSHQYNNYKALSFTHNSLEIPTLINIKASSWDILNRKKEASITVEGAAVCTLTIIIFGSFLMFFSVLYQEFHLKQMMYEVQAEATMMAINQEEELGKLLLSKSDKFKTRYGLEAANFYIDEQTGEILYVGEIRIPFLMKEDGITIKNSLRVYGFDGYQPKKEEEQIYVYVTKYGRVYHWRLDCAHLKIYIQETTLDAVGEMRNEAGAIYYPCERCVDLIKNGVCYITKDGNRIHGSADCTSLLRHIKKVLLSEVGEKRECSLCGK